MNLVFWLCIVPLLINTFLASKTQNPHWKTNFLPLLFNASFSRRPLLTHRKNHHKRVAMHDLQVPFDYVENARISTDNVNFNLDQNDEEDPSNVDLLPPIVLNVDTDQAFLLPEIRLNNNLLPKERSGTLVYDRFNGPPGRPPPGGGRGPGGPPPGYGGPPRDFRGPPPSGAYGPPQRGRGPPPERNDHRRTPPGREEQRRPPPGREEQRRPPPGREEQRRPPPGRDNQPRRQISPPPRNQAHKPLFRSPSRRDPPPRKPGSDRKAQSRDESPRQKAEESPSRGPGKKADSRAPDSRAKRPEVSRSGQPSNRERNRTPQNREKDRSPTARGGQPSRAQGHGPVTQRPRGPQSSPNRAGELSPPRRERPPSSPPRKQSPAARGGSPPRKQGPAGPGGPPPNVARSNEPGGDDEEESENEEEIPVRVGPPIHHRPTTANRHGQPNLPPIVPPPIPPITPAALEPPSAGVTQVVPAATVRQAPPFIPPVQRGPQMPPHLGHQFPPRFPHQPPEHHPHHKHHPVPPVPTMPVTVPTTTFTQAKQKKGRKDDDDEGSDTEEEDEDESTKTPTAPAVVVTPAPPRPPHHHHPSKPPHQHRPHQPPFLPPGPPTPVFQPPRPAAPLLPPPKPFAPVLQPPMPPAPVFPPPTAPAPPVRHHHTHPPPPPPAPTLLITRAPVTEPADRLNQQRSGMETSETNTMKEMGREGDSIRLVCPLKNQPDTQANHIIWTTPEQLTLRHGKSGRHVVQPAGALIVHNLQSIDEGSYTCSLVSGKQILKNGTVIVSIEDCAMSPCMNGGECEDLDGKGGTKLQCRCPEAFTGRYCETKKNVWLLLVPIIGAGIAAIAVIALVVRYWCFRKKPAKLYQPVPTEEIPMQSLPPEVLVQPVPRRISRPSFIPAVPRYDTGIQTTYPDARRYSFMRHSDGAQTQVGYGPVGRPVRAYSQMEPWRYSNGPLVHSDPIPQSHLIENPANHGHRPSGVPQAAAPRTSHVVQPDGRYQQPVETVNAGSAGNAPSLPHPSFDDYTPLQRQSMHQQRFVG